MSTVRVLVGTRKGLFDLRRGESRWGIHRVHFLGDPAKLGDKAWESLPAEYKEAIRAFRALVDRAPDHLRTPEAMLSIANCQSELKDNDAARRTLEQLVRQYPQTEAAQAARDRLLLLTPAKGAAPARKGK